MPREENSWQWAVGSWGGSEKDFALEVFVFSQDFWDGIHNEHVQLSYWWGEFAVGGIFCNRGWVVYIY